LLLLLLFLHLVDSVIHKLNFPIRESSLNIRFSFTNPSTYSPNHRITQSVHWKTIHTAVYTLLRQTLYPFKQIQPTKPTHTSTQSQINSLTQALTQSLTQSRINSLTKAVTQSLIHSVIHSFFYSLTQTHTHTLTQLLNHSLTH